MTFTIFCISVALILIGLSFAIEEWIEEILDKKCKKKDCDKHG